MSVVSEIMSPRKVVTILDDDKNTALDVADLMLRNKVGSVVVVDSSGNPVGIITERDILRRVAASDKLASLVSVREMMSTPIITVHSYDSVDTAARAMSEHKIKRLVVLETEGKVVAVISTTDIAKKLAKILSDDDNRYRSIKSLMLT